MARLQTKPMLLIVWYLPDRGRGRGTLSLPHNAASAGQTLTVELLNNTPSAQNVTVFAATLS